MDPAEAPSTTAAAAAAAATAAAAPVGEVTIEAQFALFRGLFDRGTITASEHQKLREKALGLIPDPTSHSSATHGIDNVLVAHFEEDRRRQEQPWRVEVTRHTDLKKSIACQSWEDLKTEFVDQAKNGLLSVEDVMTLTYLLFGNDDDRKFHAGCLLRLSSYESRVKAHNFHVASAREEAFMATWGSKLVKFQFPLFPKDGAFSSINLRLLREVDDGMPVGGGEAGRPSVFRRSTLSPDAAQAQAAAAAALGGEYWAPVQVGDDGIPWIDLSALEEAHTQLMDQFAKATASSEKMAKLLSRLPDKVARRTRNARARGGDFAPYAPSAVPNTQHLQQQQQAPAASFGKKPPAVAPSGAVSAPLAPPPGKKLVMVNGVPTFQ